MYDLEEEVIGCLLVHPENISKLVISDECFKNNENRFIVKLIKQQYQDIRNIDLIALGEKYKHLFNQKFNREIIIKKMVNIMTNTFGHNFDYYQELLFEKYVNDLILSVIDKFKNNQISQDELLTSIHKYEALSIKTSANKLTGEEVFKIINSKNKGINFRFEKLSKYANIQEHDLVVVAARPGIGKTGFVLNLMEDLSDRYNCILFNMEMSDKQVYQRLVGINTKIPIIYHDNPATDYQKEQLVKGSKAIANKNIKVISRSQTISSIRKRIIEESKQGHTLAFIDYVGLIGSNDKTKSLYEKTTAIVKELRQISLDYDCTIFLVAQINRNSENTKDKRPKISDLKETGELEQSATTVLMLHNENYYKGIEMKVEEIEVIIGKNRNGQTGILTLEYNQQTQRFDVKGTNKIYNELNNWRKE